MQKNPYYWGTKTGILIKSIVIDKKKSWRSIQEKTNLNTIDIIRSIKKLIEDHHIRFTREECYRIDPYILQQYTEYFSPKKVKTSNSVNVVTKDEEISEFSLGFMLGISAKEEFKRQQKIIDAEKQETNPKIFVNQYLASRKGTVYHKPTCYWIGQIRKENLITLTGDEILNYRPCKKCKPL